MIDFDKQATRETRKVHIDNLFRVVQYCENKIDCRRAQQLHYFGETKFNPTACKEDMNTVCDNCTANEKVIFFPLSLLFKSVNYCTIFKTFSFRKRYYFFTKWEGSERIQNEF